MRPYELFIVLWTICLRCFLVYFKKDPLYLTRGTARVSISLMVFLLDILVLSSFITLLVYSFNFLFHLRLFDTVYFQYSQALVSFIFSVLFLFRSSILSIVCHFPLFITSITHLSMPNSIPKYLLYILTVGTRISNSFFFFCLFWPSVCCRPFTLGGWSSHTLCTKLFHLTVISTHQFSR